MSFAHLGNELLPIVTLNTFGEGIKREGSIEVPKNLIRAFRADRARDHIAREVIDLKYKTFYQAIEKNVRGYTIFKTPI